MSVWSSMKRVGIAVALAALVGSIWFLQRPRGRAVADDDPPPPQLAPSPPAAGSQAPAKAIDKVTKLRDADARKELADRIASAHAARASTRAAPMPRLADDAVEPPETAIAKTVIRTAMRELVPHISKCYEAAIPTLPSPNLNMTAQLTLTGDPDIGTIVDAKALTDDKGTPLPAALDDCFRSTFQLMALPPLAEGDTIDVRYPFVFRAN
jgi:hypothetical protein